MYLLPEAMRVALDAEVVRPVILVFIDWPNDPVYAHNRTGDIVYDSKVWSGVGDFGSIGDVELDHNLGAHTVSLTLSGINPDTLTKVTLGGVVNRDVELHFGVLDENGQLISAFPYFYGRVSSNQMTRYDKESDTIEIEATSKTGDWGRSRPDRYTWESQKGRHANDDFFQYVTDMVDRDLWWGNSKKDTIPLVPRSKQ